MHGLSRLFGALLIFASRTQGALIYNNANSWDFRAITTKASALAQVAQPAFLLAWGKTSTNTVST